MPQTQPQTGQQAVDTTSFILEDIKRRVTLPPPVTPQDAIRAVMCTFSQHVSRGEAVQVFDALPDAVKPLLQRCMIHRGEPAKKFGRDQLLLAVSEHLEVPIEQAEEITSAVLQAISARLPAKEVSDVAAQLPVEMRDLWVVPKTPVGPPVTPHPILTRIEQSVELPQGVTGEGAFKSVMCHLTKRIPLGEARHLVAAMPSDLRQLVEPCLEGRGEHPEKIGKNTFLERIAKDLDFQDLVEAERVAMTVFKYLEEHIPASVFTHVAAQLPSELADLWVLPH